MNISPSSPFRGNPHVNEARCVLTLQWNSVIVYLGSGLVLVGLLDFKSSGGR